MKTKIKKKQKALTKIEAKRVAILKDAILQINAQKYQVESRKGYVDNGTGLDEKLEQAAQLCKIFTGKEAKDIQFNKFFDKFITPSEPCQVCAKGALLLSTIKKFNDCSLQEAFDNSLNSMAQDNEKIGDIFGEENADLMEEYFEKNDSYNWNTEKDTNMRWSDKYPEDDDRLIAIFKNAISNKGTFIPVQ